MIEIAAVLSVANQDWPSFGVILSMLFINGGIGFWQEKSAFDALDALKGQLALKSRVRRDGRWTEIEAAKLVPGDVVRLRLGDIVPADAKLLDGAYLSIDQSALTGESLPVEKHAGDAAFSGTTIKEGEMLALVYATGARTSFGKTANLVEHAGAESHFQRAVIHIGNILIVSAAALSAVLVGVEIWRGMPLLELLSFVLIVVVASIPVALPAVLSVTMALGALGLSRLKAIVTRLESIEEMAGVDVLTCDKTGTLTRNELVLGDPVAFAGTVDELILAAALASKAEDRDAIDEAVLAGVKDGARLSAQHLRAFTPFDPVHKRTEAEIESPEGARFSVTKGAPQVVLQMSTMADEERARAEQVVEDAAERGFRTLGVARSDDGGKSWSFLGILPLFDPPREDSRQTLADAKAHGIAVKMVTGDNMAIAREVARSVGLGTHIEAAGDLLEDAARSGHLVSRAQDEIERADGFAEVFPEHKYAIVKALQERHHIVAMTGDGVNDAPALKQAEVGIAVSGATDAARSAASLILTAPGLSVITRAVEEARRIFARMTSYTTYRIAMTLSIMVFVVLIMLAFNEYPLTTIMIILLALLDDIPIMTIAWDNAELSPRPVRWEMGRLLTVAVTMGALALAQSLILYAIARDVLSLSLAETQTAMFLRFIAGGHLLLFVVRTRGFFWQKPYPSAPLFWAVVATQAVGVLLAGFGWLMPAISWSLIGIVWAYDIAWMLIMDVVKVGVYSLMEHRAAHHSRFLGMMKSPLHS